LAMEDVLAKYARLGAQRRRALGRRGIAGRFASFETAPAATADYQRLVALERAAANAPSLPDHTPNLDQRFAEFQQREFLRAQVEQRLNARGGHGF
jgi:hypothetical protein